MIAFVFLSVRESRDILRSCSFTFPGLPKPALIHPVMMHNPPAHPRSLFANWPRPAPSAPTSTDRMRLSSPPLGEDRSTSAA